MKHVQTDSVHMAGRLIYVYKKIQYNKQNIVIMQEKNEHFENLSCKSNNIMTAANLNVKNNLTIIRDRSM